MNKKNLNEKKNVRKKITVPIYVLNVLNTSNTDTPRETVTLSNFSLKFAKHAGKSFAHSVRTRNVKRCIEELFIIAHP